MKDFFLSWLLDFGSYEFIFLLRYSLRCSVCVGKFICVANWDKKNYFMLVIRWL